MNIYLIENSITKEKYVGQTVKNIYARWGRHIVDAYYGKEGKGGYSLFHQKIVEYTPMVFNITLLEECSLEEVNDRERYWIDYYDTYKHGYNSTPGGQDWFKTKAEQKGQKPKKKGPVKLFQPGNEYRFKEGNKMGCKKVYQYSLDGLFLAEYESAKAAGEAIGCNPQSIRRICNNKSGKSQGYQWRWAADNLTSLSPIIDTKKASTLKQQSSERKLPPYTKRPVIQLSLAGEFIREWPSANEAAKELGFKAPVPIINCCRGLTNSSHGYDWEFKELI